VEPHGLSHPSRDGETGGHRREANEQLATALRHELEAAQDEAAYLANALADAAYKQDDRWHACLAIMVDDLAQLLWRIGEQMAEEAAI